MDLRSGSTAGTFYLLALLLVSVAFNLFLADRIAEQQDYQTIKTSHDYCETKLEAIGYQSSPSRSANGASNYYDVCLQIRNAEATEASARYTRWGASFAFAATIAAGFAAAFTWRQASIAKHALILQNRAWLAIRIPDPPIEAGRPEEAFSINLSVRGEVMVALPIHLENVGHSPAHDVRLSLTILPVGTELARKTFVEATIEGMKSKNRGHELGVVFPDETYQGPYFGNTAPARDVIDPSPVFPFAYIDVAIVCCYRIEGDDLIKITSRSFTLYGDVLKDDGAFPDYARINNISAIDDVGFVITT